MNSLNIEPVRENERNTNGIFQNKKKIYNEMDVIRGEKNKSHLLRNKLSLTLQVPLGWI